MEYPETIRKLLPSLILASRSPARKQLLEELGILVEVSPTDSDEYHGGLAGLEVVHDLARRKLEHYLAKHPEPALPVLAADTLVGLDGFLLGKPLDACEAGRHIMLLSGRSHSVYSGFALYLPLPANTMLSGSDEAVVTFRGISPDECSRYLASGDWQGAAGSYRIQGKAQQFITSVRGDIATVVGLPLQAISAILSSPDCL